MSVSEDVFSKMPAWDASAPEGADNSLVIKTPKAKDKTPGLEYLGEVAKGAIADNAEMINAGLRLAIRTMNPSMWITGDESNIPEAIRAGKPRQVTVNEAKLKAGSDPLAESVAPMVRGAVSMLSLPVPGMGPVKTAVLGAGSGELGEIGKFALGGLGEAVGGKTGRDVGGAVGEVAGSALGGYANVVRMNAVGKALTSPVEAVANAGKSLKATYDAKKAGDTRDLSVIFLDNYGDLKSKAMNMLDERAVQKVANTLVRDPLWQKQLKEFDDATTNTGVDPNPFTIGQRTGNPTLTLLEANRKLTGTQAEQALARKELQQPAIVNAYRSIVDKALPTNTPALKESFELYRASAKAQTDRLIAEEAALRERQPNWSDTQLAESGKGLRDILDEQRNVSKGEFNQRYRGVYDEVRGQGYDILPVAQDTKDVLRPLRAQVDTAVVPDSIRRLDSLLKRSEAAQRAAAEEASNRPFYMQNQPLPMRKGNYSFEELHDLSSALSEDAHIAYKNKETDKGRALDKINQALQNQMQRQTPPETWQKFQSIQGDYATKYVPRFKEGTNFNLDREATVANRAREKITDQNVWGAYLKKGDMVDKMEQFDNAFSGRLGPRVPQAYDQLSQAIANRYSKEVLNPGFNQDRHAAFLADYDAALDRVPNLRADLERTAANIDAIQQSKQGIVDRYKEVVGAPLTSSVGPVQAQQLFIEAMADPAKMQRLLASPVANTPEKAQSVLREAMLYAHPMSGNTYDPSKLTKLFDMGQKYPGEPGTFGMLLEKALGKKEGQLHEMRLRGIATLMEREAMTDPNSLRFESAGNGPVREATGQSAASILTGLNSMDRGFGATYFPLLSAGRFLNNKVQKQMAASMEKALYDPKMSEAIFELARAKSSGGQVSPGALEMVLGKSGWAKDLIKELGDHGMISAQVARGAAYGLQQATQDQKDMADNVRDEIRFERLRGMTH